ncbi:hypothetical protein BDDG_01342 [Blastomyces dermatitidis ATCC 18188]|uniref:BZIP domain-containing protein n=1 Tax=Ajellomyces dermatitidis (strain ATCC 18188 / CBS 674.68) TaxID=653446 RepID=F2T4H7_AJEDA|nr:hypothetical protein BDDG_01342 [Blastomyces dermatitidis ATCC 18188]
MSTPTNLKKNNNNDDDSRKSQKKSRDHTLTRVRNNQRRCRERRRQYIATLEQKVQETDRLLNEARAEIAKLRSELMECRSHRPLDPDRDNQLAAGGGSSASSSSGGGGGGGGGGGRGVDSIDAAPWSISFGEMGGYRHVSGHDNQEEERELLDLLPSPIPAELDDSWVASSTFYDQTVDIGYNNVMPNPPPLQQVDILSSPSPALITKPCGTAACGSKPPDAIAADAGAATTPPTASLSLSTISTPTLTALQLQDLVLPNIPASLLISSSSSSSSSSIYTLSPADESTTSCAQAFIFISQQNFKGVDASVIERWLCCGFRQATDPREGCRVENNLLFQVLDFISGP